MDDMTPEQIAQCYSACMDSVDLINNGKPEFMDDAEWNDCLDRNVRHLELMLSKGFWTNEDLSPLQEAVS